MNITLTITGGTAAEIQQAVNELSNSFAIGIKGDLLEVKTTEPNPKPLKTKLQPNEAVPQGIEEAPAAAEAPTDCVDYTLEDVRAAANKKAEAGKRKEIKALITSFGDAKNLNALDPKHYSAFMQKINEL